MAILWLQVKTVCYSFYLGDSTQPKYHLFATYRFRILQTPEDFCSGFFIYYFWSYLIIYSFLKASLALLFLTAQSFAIYKYYFWILSIFQILVED